MWAGERVTLNVRIFNHASLSEAYRLGWNTPPGWRLIEADKSVRIAARKEGMARAVFATGAAGLQVVTADVGFAGRELHEWIEALVRVN